MAWLGIAVAVLLLGLRLLADQVYLLAIPLGLGVASILYVLASSRWRSGSPIPTVPTRAIDVLPSVVLLALAVLVFRTRTPTPRTGIDYLLAAVVGGAILAQVLLVGDDRFAPAPVLVQVGLAALVIRFSVLFGTAGFVGVDAWTHVPVYVQNIAASGSLSAIADSKYVMAPIYHLVGAVGTTLFGDPRVAVFLAIGALIPLSMVFVYATAAVFVSARWAVLAATVYAFADQFIRWGIHVIPTSLALVFFLAVLYLLTLTLLGDREPWVLTLLVGFSLAVVFTHQVTTAILLVLLAVGVGVATLARMTETDAPSPVPVAGVFVLTLGVTVLSWLNTPFGDESIFLYNRLELLAVAANDIGFLQLAADHAAPPTMELPVSGSPSPVGRLADVVGFTVLFGIAAVGGLTALDWDRPAGPTYLLLVTAGLLFVAVFGLQFIGFRILIPGRWTVFLYALLAILGAIGVATLYDRAPRGVIIAAVVLLAAVYPATMVVAEKSSLDSPAFEDTFTKYAYSESEIAALETIGTIHPPSVEDDIRTDHPYVAIYKSPGGYDARTLAVNESGPVEPTPVLYRSYQSEGRVVFDAGADEPRASVAGSYPADFVCQSDWDRVYVNDEVTMCTPVGDDVEAPA
ncbi:glycosyltransferase family 39 protein [Halanaeroarchaeum sp. HSR-CO]|uniref:glycosyltransferase family 39 protein n=1 Tax=Halanaeroarchaeum sp. HSR-CO TaxID=2866382 RepID=UPI00217CD54D|nr:glycosyltransferase family 39 protein [Halanaeroarchaeum sp. HSR-CO]